MEYITWLVNLPILSLRILNVRIPTLQILVLWILTLQILPLRILPLQILTLQSQKSTNYHFPKKHLVYFLHLSFLSKIWRIRRFRIDCWLLLNKLKPNFFGVSTYLYAFFCEYCSCKKTEGQRKIKLTLNNLSLHINKIMQQWVTQGKIIILPTSIQLPPTLQLRLCY